MINIVSREPTFLINASELVKQHSEERVNVASSWQNLQLQQDSKLLMVHHSMMHHGFVNGVRKVPHSTEILLILPRESGRVISLPSSYLVFHIISESELQRDFGLAWKCILSGCHFKGPSFNQMYKSIRSAINSPKELGISEREVEVMNLMIRGHSISSTARILNITDSTVKKHLGKIRDKMKVSAIKKIVDMLRKFHWCDFQSGEVLHF